MTQRDRDMFSAANASADEELAPFDVRDSSGKSGMIKLALGLGFLLILALLILKVYQPGVRDRAAPPKITAENTPFKIKPENEGGVQTPNQDKTVYDVMDGKAPNEVVNPSPNPEVPIELPKRLISKLTLRRLLCLNRLSPRLRQFRHSLDQRA